MKYLDRVRLISEKYEKDGVKKGQSGTILNSEIRFGTFNVAFEPKSYDHGECDIFASIKVKDLELIEDRGMTDEEILVDLPLNDPNWWCKVEDGYILNLKGERKNKIPYDYNS